MSENIPGDRPATRQNGGVPARRPVPDMPENVRTMHSVLGSATRLSVLKHLLDHSPATRQQIAEATGVSVPAAGVALRQLDEAGYLDADIPAEQRVGRMPLYSVQRRRVLDDAGAFFSWIAQ